jgi:hypothetical protein
MAERIVSPGVFTQERDLSFLEQGIGEIAGAFIGPTPKGPAFIPTTVNNQQEYINTFGSPDDKSFLGFTVLNYLGESARATVVRVLGLDGYSPINHTPALIYASGSNGSFVYAVVHPTVAGSDISDITVTGSPTNFDLVISSSAIPAVSTTGLSTNQSAGSYIGNFLGTGPNGTKNGYLYGVFPEAVTLAGSGAFLTAETNEAALHLTGSTFGVFKHASTPWIQSQTLGGTKIDLFKVHTLTDGVAANRDVKVSIIGPKKSPIQGEYGTFTLLVRGFTDTDAQTAILEQYDNLNLDPDSPNYVARAIGNSSPITDPLTGERLFEGEYRNLSRYIRIEMTDGAENFPTDALPFGFGPLNSPIGTDTDKVVPPTFITSTWVLGGVRGFAQNAIRNVNEFYGYEYSDLLNTNLSFLAPIPSGSVAVGTGFNLEDLGSDELYDGGDLSAPVLPENFTSTPSIISALKFTVPFQGGFDGDNPARLINMYDSITATNSQGFNLSQPSSAGSRAYIKAINAISNPDDIDINLLILPGVIYELHPFVATYALNVCESRADCFYILDLVQATATITSVVNQASLIDSNYAASYYPWIRVREPNTNKLVFMPPSAVMPEVYAYNDNEAAEWFAPAGLNRGGVRNAAGVKVRLRQLQRDTLYEGKVNPIAQFPGQGVCVWGQKTLQRRASALDRINVRRLLITVKKFIASSARFLVFEQNVESTRRRFLNTVNPFLAGIQERAGLFAFRVIMDETNNTPDIIDRNILVGTLFLQPTRTAEIIKLEFNVLPTGATFPDA